MPVVWTAMLDALRFNVLIDVCVGGRSHEKSVHNNCLLFSQLLLGVGYYAVTNFVPRWT